MKLTILKNRVWTMLSGVIVASVLTACGQTGPLYMPKVPPAPVPSSADITVGVTPAKTPADSTTSVSIDK